jgi:hypothetical protein
MCTLDPRQDSVLDRLAERRPWHKSTGLAVALPAMHRAQYQSRPSVSGRHVLGAIVSRGLSYFLPMSSTSCIDAASTIVRVVSRTQRSVVSTKALAAIRL